MSCEKRRENCIFLTGISFIFFGLFFLLFWEKTQEKIVTERFKLSETSKTYEPWIKTRVPIYVQYYFFNWTNPSDLKGAKGERPQLTQVGPYKFWEKIEKVNVTWNENGTVTYLRKRKWQFDPEGSKGSLGDKITTINVIALMAAKMVYPMPSLGRIAMGMFVSGTQKIFVSKTVSEFLFEGYVDPLLTAGRGWPTISSKVPYDRFGWFYKRNGSATFDGIFNVETGENGMDRFGSVSEWNFKNETKFFDGDCGRVQGSGGEFWPWKRTKETDIYLFSPDLCRYIRYRYSEEVRISEIDGLKFTTDSNLFDNGTSDSGNKCFCNGECLPSGVLNISSCRFGAPVFTSYPHFHQADPIYRKSFDGLKPDKDLHENYIALEPTYGIPLEIAARIQINVLVKPNRHLSLLDGVRELLFPVFWLEQRVFVPPEKLTEIKMLLRLPTIIFALSVAFIFLGTICLSIFAYYKTGKNHRAMEIHKYRIEPSSSCYRESKGLLKNRSKNRIDYPTVKSMKSLETDF